MHALILRSATAPTFRDSFAFVLDPFPPELFDLARAEFGGDIVRKNRGPATWRSAVAG